MEKQEEDFVPMSKADRDAAAAFIARYGRNSQMLNYGMTGMALLMMAVLYWVEVPVPVAVFFGLFILGILMLAGWMTRKTVSELRLDLDSGKKRVFRGVIMGKRRYDKDEGENNLNYKELASFRRSGDGIWNLSGRDVHVSAELFKDAEVGQEVVLHVLPATRIPFKVERGPLFE